METHKVGAQMHTLAHQALPPLPCMVFVSGMAELGALGVLLGQIYYYTISNQGHLILKLKIGLSFT